MVTDGRCRLYTAGLDGYLHHWDISTGRILESFPSGGGAVWSMALSGNSLLALGYASLVDSPPNDRVDAKTGRFECFQSLRRHWVSK